jgi:hypothetical protein
MEGGREKKLGVHLIRQRKKGPKEVVKLGKHIPHSF